MTIYRFKKPSGEIRSVTPEGEIATGSRP